jgi:tRNA(fMet)-specific endonuclease VapC
LLLKEHSKVVERWRQETDQVVVSIVSRIEIFQGRYATMLKAANGSDLKLAQQRLDRAERDLRPFDVLPITDAVGAKFDELLRSKRTQQVGRADLLIACVVLSRNATLVTRNIKDFKRVPGLRLENWAD